MSWTEDEAYQPHQDAAREIGRATSAAIKGVVAARLASGKIPLKLGRDERGRQQEIDRENAGRNQSRGQQGQGLSR
jgi:hypothetical protein